MIIKKCKKCGAIVNVLEDCNCNDCGILCCGENMEILKENSVDASFEKHIPTYEINGDVITVRVNHVMEEDHYIEWIAFENNNSFSITYLKPGDEPVAYFKYLEGTKVYAYCNKHDLWSSEIK